MTKKKFAGTIVRYSMLRSRLDRRPAPSFYAPIWVDTEEDALLLAESWERNGPHHRAYVDRVEMTFPSGFEIERTPVYPMPRTREG